MLSGPIIVVGFVATGSLVLAVGLSVTVMKLKKDFRRLQKRLSEQPHAENPATDFSSSLSRVEQKFIGPKRHQSVTRKDIATLLLWQNRVLTPLGLLLHFRWHRLKSNS